MKAPVEGEGAAHRLRDEGRDRAVTALLRKTMGLGTILWVTALIVVSLAPGLLRAAPSQEPMSWSQARLERWDHDLAHREVHLSVPGVERVWRITGAEVALRVDRVATRALAGAPQRPEGSPDLPVVTLETWRIRSLLRERVAGAVRVDPEPASLDPEGKIVPDRPGRYLNLAGAERLVREAFLSRAPTDGPARVELPVVPVRASVTADELRRLGPWVRLASYGTRFDPADGNRASNIRLGAELIDGTLLEPGDVFSFNHVVGRRTEARGFKPAPIIVSRKLVTGMGGGVCQLSSTTYNAALLSGLEVVERQAHSIPVTYLPLGRDATVFDDLIDLRFRNGLSHPVIVQSWVEGDHVIVSIWGHPDDRRRIGVRVRTVESLPPPLEWEGDEPQGATRVRESLIEEGSPGVEVVDPGRSGYVVEVERIFYGPDGTVEQVEFLSRDVYPPEPRRVRATLRPGS